jgi:tetratricopeptide (TPR) repeat protein
VDAKEEVTLADPIPDRQTRSYRFVSPDLGAHLDAMMAFFERNQPFPGAVDVACLGDASTDHDAAAFSVALCTASTEDGPLYRSVLVLLPPDHQEKADIHTLCVGMFRSRVADLTASKAERVTKSRIKIIRLASFDLDALLRAAEGVERTAIVVVGAAKYRAARPVIERAEYRVDDAPLGSAMRLITHESTWAPHVVELTGLFDGVANGRHLYVLLLTGEPAPILPATAELLHSIRGALFAAQNPADLRPQVVAKTPEWTQRIVSGDDESVFREIDDAIDSPINRAFTRAQVLLFAGRAAEAYEAAASHWEELCTSSDPANLVTLSRMALARGNWREATALLRGALDTKPRNEFPLRIVHQQASALNAKPEESEALELLRQLHPRSAYRLTIDSEDALASGRYDDVMELLRGADEAFLPEALSFRLFIARLLREKAGNQYDQEIEETRERFPALVERAAILCTQHAVRHDALEAAAKLLTSHPWTKMSELAADLATHIILRWAVDAPERLEGGLSIVLDMLNLLVDYLATHPEDGRRRVLVSDALSFERTGKLGLALLLRAIDAAPRIVREPTLAPPSRVATAAIDVPSFFERYLLARPAEQRGMLLAPEPLPIELTAAPLEGLWNATFTLLENAGGQYSGQPDDRNALLTMGKFSMDLGQHLGMVEHPFEVLRSLAGAFGSVSDYQSARDTAEHALRLAGNSSSAQKHAAWLVFTDAYLRCGSIPEALLGWLCSESTGPRPVTPAQLSLDTQLHIRLLRDGGLHAQALELLDRAEEALGPHLGPHQVAHLKATIIVRRDWEAGEDDSDALLTCQKAVLISLRLALEAGAEPIPATMLAAQIVAQVDRLGVELLPGLREAVERARSMMSPELANRVHALATAAPDREQLTTWLRALATTRDPSDLGTDASVVHLLARRALEGFVASGSANDAALAIEAMALHTIRPPSSLRSPEAAHSKRSLDAIQDWSSRRAVATADPRERAALTRTFSSIEQSGARRRTTLDRLGSEPDTLVDYALALSSTMDVHLLGLTQTSLVRVSFLAGDRRELVEEQSDTFDTRRLADWRTKHPAAFGGTTDPTQRELAYLHASMIRVGTTIEPATRGSVYVLSQEMVDVPANLLLARGEPAGAAGPVAAVPSLSWLREAHQTPRRSVARYGAWLFPSGENISPLAILSNELETPLRARGFAVSTETNPPIGLEGSDITVVGAHGCLWNDNGPFRAVADEGVERMSASALAAELADCGVVVLLICSGGRIDREALSFRASGLPYELLQRGCRAVVASPWAISALVARQWVIKFVDSCLEGMPVAEAAFAASRLVAKREPGFCDSLAMQVFGDPALRLCEPMSSSRA